MHYLYIHIPSTIQLNLEAHKNSQIIQIIISNPKFNNTKIHIAQISTKIYKYVRIIRVLGNNKKNFISQ